VSDEERKAAAPEERPPRLRLIRVFLSLLVGFMAGLVGWTVVVMAALLGQGLTANVMARLPSLPPILQIVAFFGPAVAVGGWFFRMLGSSR
jgi:hypothetical protein